jgi:hypothetical protein
MLRKRLSKNGRQPARGQIGTQHPTVQPTQYRAPNHQSRTKVNNTDPQDHPDGQSRVSQVPAEGTPQLSMKGGRNGPGMAIGR